VLFVSILHFLPACAADAAVAAFRERMAPGSYLVISAGHGNDRSLPVQDQIQAAYGSDTVLTSRTETEFAAYFGDFELMPPGVVPITEWPLDTVDPPQSPPLRLVPPPTSAGMLAGIGRKRP
jgi:S-adenosyl methyltransferase